MKVLFLTLLLGVVCAAQEEEAEQSVAELSGEWRTVYFGSSCTEKTADTTANGTTRLYVCKVVFNSDEGTVEIYLCVEEFPHVLINPLNMFLRLNGKWEKITVTGKKEDDNTYIFEYEGTKRLKVAYLSDTVLILCVFNVDEQGVETPCAVILAVKISVNQEVMDIFNKLISEKDIKEENVVNFIESGLSSLCTTRDQNNFRVSEKGL
ncbi:hypothetical protein R6Z07F_019651 [Ovis aries]